MPAATQGVHWRSHTMKLPWQISPGMIVWAVDVQGALQPRCVLSVEALIERGKFTPFVRVGAAALQLVVCRKASYGGRAAGLGTAAVRPAPPSPSPATPTSTLPTHAQLQARGIVVDGVVASPHPSWGQVWGRVHLPAVLEPHVPVVLDALMLPLFWAYKTLGPGLAERINSHPFFREHDLFFPLVGNALVWGQLCTLALLLAGARAVSGTVGGRRAAAGRRSRKCKAE